MSYTRRRYSRDERPPASTFATTSSVASSPANALTVCHASYRRGSCTRSSSTAGTSAPRGTEGGGVRGTAGAPGGGPQKTRPPARAARGGGCPPAAMVAVFGGGEGWEKP